MPPPAAEAAPPAVRPAKAGAWGRFLVGLGVGVVIGSLAPRPVEREEGSEPRPAARRNAVVSEDVDGDGKDDTWTTYRDGRAVGSVQDIDGDGRSDLWNEFDSRGAVSVQRADTDFDGRVDSWATFRGLRTVSASQDRNRDGRPDRWTRYDDAGQASSEDEDNDFDGEPDAWYTYRAAQLVEGREDTDFDGTADVLLRYRHSLLVEAVWEPRPGAPGRMVVYRHGQRHEELRDLDGDGDYDLRIAFDPFESPMEQVEIR
jgi:hypothetical protein